MKKKHLFAFVVITIFVNLFICFRLVFSLSLLCCSIYEFSKALKISSISRFVLNFKGFSFFSNFILFLYCSFACCNCVLCLCVIGALCLSFSFARSFSFYYLRVFMCCDTHYDCYANKHTTNTKYPTSTIINQ